jgi:hypothetical protein
VNEASLCDLGTQVSSKSIIAPPASSNNHAKLGLELIEQTGKEQLRTAAERCVRKLHDRVVNNIVRQRRYEGGTDEPLPAG